MSEPAEADRTTVASAPAEPADVLEQGDEARRWRGYDLEAVLGDAGTPHRPATC